MNTSGYIAVAALLLSMALSWKSLMKNGNSTGLYAKGSDMDKLIDRVAELEQMVEDLKTLRADFEKLTVKVHYDLSTRLTLVEREIFRQELIDELERKKLSPRKDL